MQRARRHGTTSKVTFQEILTPSTHATHTLSLPTEIKLKISTYLWRKADVLNIMLADSTFLEIGQRILYQHVNLEVHFSGSLPRQTSQWCDTILARPELARHIRETELGEKYLIGAGDSTDTSGFQRLVRALKLGVRLRWLKIGLRTELQEKLVNQLEFPELDVLQTIIPLRPTAPFLARHPTIRSMRISKFQGNMVQTNDLLPNLRFYDGPISFTRGITTSANLSYIKTDLRLHNDTEYLLDLLKIHGKDLRYLALTTNSRDPYLNPTGRIGDLVPELQYLSGCLEVSDNQVCHNAVPIVLVALNLVPQLSQKLEVESSVTCLSTFSSLHTLILTYLGEGLSRNLTIEWVAAAHRACPTLRCIRFTDSHSDFSILWLFYEAKMIWVAPRYSRTWWETIGVESGLTDSDLDALPAIPRDPFLLRSNSLY